MRKFLTKQPEGDLYAPTIYKIDHINQVVKDRGYLWRNFDEAQVCLR